MQYALEALRRRPGRTILTALGVGLATALVLILLSLSAGIEGSAYRLATRSGVDLLGTSANTSISSGTFPPIGSAHRLPAEFEAADSNVASASPWLVVSMVFANASLYAAVNGSANGSTVPAGWGPADATSIGWIPGDNAGLEVPALVAGAPLPSSGDPHYGNGTFQGPRVGEIVLNSALASLMHVGPNQTVWANPQSPPGPAQLRSWYANATAFRVAGISGPFWFLPSALLGEFYLSELQQLVVGNSSQSDFASLVLLHLNDPSRASQDQRELEAAFTGITFFTLADVLGAVQKIIDLYRTFGTLVGLIGVIVATLFTATVLLMSVDDRSREIALLRVLGFSQARIGAFVVEEGVLLGMIGLAVGLPVGFAGAYLLERFLDGFVPNLPAGFSFVSFDASVLLAGFSEVLLIGLVASLLPLVRALQIPAAEELRAA